MIDVYQAATQMTDESDQTYPFTPNTLLDNALGSLGYYGAFTANMHTDSATIPQNDALIASAQARGVPIVSGKQMLTWIDGRNASSYGDIAWNTNTLTFTVAVGAGATGLTGMLPTAGPSGTQLTGITRGGSAVTYQERDRSRAWSTRSSPRPPAPTPRPTARRARSRSRRSVRRPVLRSTDQTANLRWTTTTVATSEVSLGTSATTLTTTKVKREATRKHTVSVGGLKPGTRYYYRVTSRDAKGVARTSPAVTEAPATFVTPAADTKKPTATAPDITALPDGSARSSGARTRRPPELWNWVARQT